MTTVERLSKAIFDFAYEMAMKDATLQNAYEGEKKWIAGVGGAKNAVRDYIDKVFEGFKNQEAHDQFFYYTVDRACAVINDARPDDGKSEFTFGNAQKLINMTAKYMYITSYQNPGLRERFSYCHCPVDSYMLADVWEASEESLKNKDYNKTRFTVSWSKEKKDPDLTGIARYLDFQSAVRELAGKDGLSPIEYDYLHWAEAKANSEGNK